MEEFPTFLFRQKKCSKKLSFYSLKATTNELFLKIVGLICYTISSLIISMLAIANEPQIFQKNSLFVTK